MFERFTDRARRVVVLAQEEARILGHNYIGTEHILLGLIQEQDGVAARVLQQLGISGEAVRSKVEGIIGTGSGTPSGHIPFTPRAKKVLELSLREALQLGHNYIGTEHILLGLVREGQGVAAQVLVGLGIDLSRVRNEVIHQLGGLRGGPAGRAPAGAAMMRSRETPAAARAGVEARRLAGSNAVASHHYLLALLADADSMATKALAALGVTREAVEAQVAQLDLAGTSDETPEEAGARRIRMRVQDKVLTLEIDDAELAASLEKALVEHEARIIAGTDPLAEGTGFPNVWSAVSRTVEDLTRRVSRAATRSGAAKGTGEWRPPGWQAGRHAGAYWVVRTATGIEGHLDVTDADPAEIRAWLRDWLAANGPSINAGGDVEVLWAYVDRAGESFAMASFGFGANGPPGSEPVPLEILVREALVDLGSAA